MTRRVLFFGSFDVGEGYPRARSLIQAAEAWGIETSVLRQDLLPVRGKRLGTISRPWAWPSAAWRMCGGARALRERLRRYLAEHPVDAIVVPYPGHFAVRWVRDIWDGPIVLDLFLSLADTAVGDRKMFRRGGVAHRLFSRIDRRACESADRVFLDTVEHAEFVAHSTGLPTSKFDFVPIGDPDAPALASEPPGHVDGLLRALYVGTGAPLHGVETVLSACARVDGLELTFVGGTPAHRAAARSLGVAKVPTVLSWVDGRRLHDLLESHHVVFGVFGTGDKAQRVVPFKVVHALAHGRVAITAETSAVQTLLEPGADCLTTPAGDPAALSRALAGVVGGPQLLTKIGQSGRRRYERTFSAKAIGRRFLGVLEEATGSAWLADAGGAECIDASELETVTSS